MSTHSNQKPILPILFASNPDGLKGLAAAGASVLAHRTPKYHYEIHVMELDVQEADKELITQSWKRIDPEAGVRWLTADKDRLRQFRYMGGDNLTYARLYLGEVFGDNRVLYLDIDVVATTSVEPLFETDLQGKVLGAVYQEKADFFNAGVLLFDVAVWKAQGLQDTIEQVLKERPYFHDQDGLNHVIPQGEWVALDSTWNACNTTHPGSILHYRTHIKPWESTEEKFALFYHYLDMTAYQGWRPEKNLTHKNRSAFAGFFNRLKWKLMVLAGQ